MEMQPGHSPRADERDADRDLGRGRRGHGARYRKTGARAKARRQGIACGARATDAGTAHPLSLGTIFSRTTDGETMRVLILDGNERTALAAARSLIAAGYDVYIAAR